MKMKNVGDVTIFLVRILSMSCNQNDSEIKMTTSSE
jgi:hypothetical protein